MQKPLLFFFLLSISIPTFSQTKKNIVTRISGSNTDSIRIDALKVSSGIIVYEDVDPIVKCKALEFVSCNKKETGYPLCL
jgi:hypothetical protein